MCTWCAKKGLGNIAPHNDDCAEHKVCSDCWFNSVRSSQDPADRNQCGLGLRICLVQAQRVGYAAASTSEGGASQGGATKSQSTKKRARETKSGGHAETPALPHVIRGTSEATSWVDDAGQVREFVVAKASRTGVPSKVVSSCS